MGGLLTHFRHSSNPTIRLFATNPSIVTGGASGVVHYLVRVTPFAAHCQSRFRHTREVPKFEANSFTALTRLGSAAQAAPILWLNASEDARALVVGQELFITYSRPKVARGRCRMVLQRVGWPSVERLGAPVHLRLPGANRIEKNWIPLRTTSTPAGNATLLMSYSIEPHVVVGCDTRSGQCARLYNTSSPLWRERLPRATRERVSGGTSCAPLQGHGLSVCVAHFKPVGTSRYYHIFYAISNSPPYAVQRVSAPFKLPKHPSTRSGIQFASGLALWPDAETLTISYGEADCYASTVQVAKSEVLRWLEPDGAQAGKARARRGSVPMCQGI